MERKDEKKLQHNQTKDSSIRLSHIFPPFIAFLLFDQAIKHYFVENTYYIINRQFALNLFGNNLLAICLGVVLIVIFIIINKDLLTTNRAWLVSIIVSAGSSNIIDRIIYGGVVDYVFLGRLPVFNLADVIISIGVIILIYLFIKDSKLAK